MEQAISPQHHLYHHHVRLSRQDHQQHSLLETTHISTQLMLQSMNTTTLRENTHTSTQIMLQPMNMNTPGLMKAI